MNVASVKHARTLGFVFSALLLIGSATGHAEEPASWNNLNLGIEHSSVVIRTPGSTSFNPQANGFVVTHGMGGTSDDDRFHRLAEAIAATHPDSVVLLLDWSEASRAEIPFLRWPNPFLVSERIDRVASDAVRLLRRLGIDPKQTTLIGESFGNWINAEIAVQLSGVDRILAMNPASELGGYEPPDMSRHARLSLAFHTYSILDTLKRVSHFSILLETPAGTNAGQWHTFGISQLTEWLQSGDRQWLEGDIHLKRGADDTFDGVATLDGHLLETKRRMQPPDVTNTASDCEDQKPSSAPPPAEAPDAEALLLFHEQP